MKIGNRKIGAGQKPFIIAEMSNNHNRDFDYALRFVDEAAKAGADALKLQTYNADIITMNVRKPEFYIDDPDSPWCGKYLHDLYNDAHMPWEWHEPLMDRARELGIECFSSPFGNEAVDLLEALDVPAYKIASFEITHLPLIRRCAQTGKPVILSCGMANAIEIDDAVRTLEENGCFEYALLKCTSRYPSDASDSNLATMPIMQERYPNALIGLSDHTLGVGVPCAAVVHGAHIIEKHFIVDPSRGGLDEQFSMSPSELSALCAETEKAWLATGEAAFGRVDAESKSMKFRESLWIAKPIACGDTLTHEHVKICRPNFGLAPKNIDWVIGRKVNRDIDRGYPLLSEHLVH